MGITNNKYYFGFIKDGHEAKEYIKCKHNPIYFMKTYLKVSTLKDGLVPFSLFLFQEMLVNIFTRKRHSIILKPRQMGITTIVCAYVLWLCLFHSRKNVVLISIKFMTAKNMLRKIKEMYRFMPDFLKEPTVNGKSGDIGTAHQIEFANGSMITAVSGSEDAARSDSLSLLVMDETAFIQQADGIWASAYPTLATGGRSILLSTAFGMGNFFHKQWTKAIQGEGAYPVKLNWRMRPDYDDAWYQRTRQDLGLKRTAQEIDCDFLSSGMNVFNMAVIKALEEELKELPILYKEQAGFEGHVLQYHLFDPTKSYVIGADIATGRASDSSTFSIYDNEGLEYACYKGKILPREFAYLLIKWGYKFNQATLAPEINSVGEGVMAILQDQGYENIFNDVADVKKVDEWTFSETDVMGWLTTGKSRSKIITGFDEDLEQGLIKPRNPYMITEASTFIYDNYNRPVAMGKGKSISKSSEFYQEAGNTYSDDAIFGECIANEVRKKVKTINRLDMGLGFAGGYA